MITGELKSQVDKKWEAFWTLRIKIIACNVIPYN
jgi:hypothetical protein